MKKIFLVISLTFSCFLYSQTVYDVTPGTKGNRIIITLENESKTTIAKNVEVKVIKPSPALNFAVHEQVVKIIDQNPRMQSFHSI